MRNFKLRELTYKHIAIFIITIMVLAALFSHQIEKIHERKEIDRRERLVGLIRSELTNRQFGSESSQINPKKTQVESKNSGPKPSETATMVRIYNPNFTRDIAKSDFDSHFYGMKFLASMESSGFKKITFTNGKKNWTFPAKISDIDTQPHQGND